MTAAMTTPGRGLTPFEPCPDDPLTDRAAWSRGSHGDRRVLRPGRRTVGAMGAVPGPGSRRAMAALSSAAAPRDAEPRAAIRTVEQTDGPASFRDRSQNLAGALPASPMVGARWQVFAQALVAIPDREGRRLNRRVDLRCLIAAPSEAALNTIRARRRRELSLRLCAGRWQKRLAPAGHERAGAAGHQPDPTSSAAADAERAAQAFNFRASRCALSPTREGPPAARTTLQEVPSHPSCWSCRGVPSPRGDQRQASNLALRKCSSTKLSPLS